MNVYRYAIIASVAACFIGGACAAQPASAVNAPQAASGGQNAVPNDAMQTTVDTAASPRLTATSAAEDASARAEGNVRVIANAPVPDTAESRAKYGQPLSNAGRRSQAAGN